MTKQNYLQQRKFEVQKRILALLDKHGKIEISIFEAWCFDSLNIPYGDAMKYIEELQKRDRLTYDSKEGIVRAKIIIDEKKEEIKKEADKEITELLEAEND